ncbi:hypothetical protein SAMN05216548_102401 [Faunimonas pinastri]|uniref:DUF4148 domain-containing protein n=1 Tax=Faunimonas pinastri TaxID=1855383 RepID=A0A1H9DAM3_9HYPH|nr:hypothetical protein [Faunimonas pinastri]SEQ10399.1 hypothetical protein SAMN05216548_102401 [Faunimonas pinastri]
MRNVLIASATVLALLGGVANAHPADRHYAADQTADRPTATQLRMLRDEQDRIWQKDTNQYSAPLADIR